MFALRRILFATDFSDIAELACKRAGELAKALGAELCLLHVIEHVPHTVEEYRYVEKNLVSRMQGQAEELRKEGIRVRENPLLKVGRAWRAIVSAAEFLEVELIVMGPGSHEGATGVALGSTTDRVLRAATSPVLVVPPSMTKIERVLCAVDFSDWSRDALRRALELGHVLGAEVTALNVVTEHAAYPNVRAISIAVRDPSLMVGEMRAADELESGDRVAWARRKLDELVTSIGSIEGVDAKRQVARAERADQAIARCAEQGHFDLIVMGAVGGGGAPPMMGNTTERVAARLPCGLLSTRGARVRQLAEATAGEAS